MPPPQRRIEDRIRELCAKTVTNTGDLEPTLQELSQLLRETIEHMRLSATTLLVEGKPLSEPRRRVNDRTSIPTLLGSENEGPKKTAGRT